MDFRGSRADAEGKGQAAAPIAWRHWPPDRFEQRLGIGVGNGQHGNFCERPRFANGQSLSISGGTDAGSQRIAHENSAVLHAATLHAVLRTPWAFWKNGTAGVAVIAGIGINDAADGAMLGANQRLDAAPGVPVARNHDGALHGDTATLQLLVVVWNAVVHVDERADYVAIDGVGVVRGDLLGSLIRSEIFGNG